MGDKKNKHKKNKYVTEFPFHSILFYRFSACLPFHSGKKISVGRKMTFIILLYTGG